MANGLISFSACLALLLLASGPAFAQDQQQHPPRLRGYTTVKPASHTAVEGLKNELLATGKTNKSMLPLFTFSVESDRDGNNYTGVIVGANPFQKGGNRNVHVKTFVIPLIVTFNSVATSFTPSPPPVGRITVGPGVTTIDPTVPDTACLANAPNNPTTLSRYSPPSSRTRSSTWVARSWATPPTSTPSRKENFGLLSAPMARKTTT